MNCEENNTKNKNYNYLKEKSNGEYLNAYINTTKEKLEGQIISIPTLLFGPFYYLYKKIWSYGIIYLVLYIITDLIPYTNISILSKIIINIILSLIFNKQYLKYATYEVESILNFKSNKTKEEILKECKRKGKNINIILIIIIFIIYIKIAITNNIIYNEVPEEKTTSDNNILNISYNIPKEFEIITKEDNYASYAYKEENDQCFMTITTIKESNTAIDHLRERTKSDEGYERNDYKTEKINDYEWTTLFMEKTSSIKDYYAIKHKDNIYEISFESISDKNNDICNKYKNKILNKITFK